MLECRKLGICVLFAALTFTGTSHASGERAESADALSQESVVRISVENTASDGADQAEVERDRKHGIKLIDYSGNPEAAAALSKILDDSPPDRAKLQSLDGGVLVDLLQRATRVGAVNSMKALLDAGAAIDGRGPEGGTALHVALLSGQVEAAKTLLDRGADPKIPGPDNVSVESMARVLGDKDLLWKLALGRGDTDSAKLLGLAAAAGKTERLQEALAAGADISAVDSEGLSPLHRAVLHGNDQSLQFLINAGANIDQPGPDGLTPLGAAVLASNAAAIDALLAAGASANAVVSGTPILSIAIARRDESSALKLLEAGANPLAADEGGMRAVDLAVALGLDHFAKKVGDVPPRHQAAGVSVEALLKAIEDDDEDRVRQLLGSPEADLEAELGDGWRPLHVAAAKGKVLAFSALLSMGADFSATNDKGENAFHLIAGASRKSHPAAGRLPLAQLASERRSDLVSSLEQRDVDGRTPVLVAILNKESAIADVLIEFGSVEAANSVDKDGLSPLVAAVLMDDGLSVQKLIAAGATVVAPSTQVSLQDIARAKENWSALAALPLDREFPVLPHKGMSRDDRKKVQQALRDWGYYKGTIDGVFGAHTSAALKAFFRDRNREIVNMARLETRGIFLGEWFMETAENGDETYGDFRVKDGNTGWYSYYWTSDGWEGRHFVGFVRRLNIREGIGLWSFPDGSEYVLLLGTGGLRDALLLPKIGIRDD